MMRRFLAPAAPAAAATSGGATDAKPAAAPNPQPAAGTDAKPAASTEPEPGGTGADAPAAAEIPGPAPTTAEARLAAHWRVADEAWARRHLPGGLDEGDEALRAAEAVEKGRYETLWRKSRALFWRAETAADDDAREAFAKDGWDAAEAAVAARERGVEGHYWAAVNAGIYAQAIGVLKALTSGVEGPFLRHLRFALEHAPGIDDGGPGAALGRYHYELPWPRYDGEASIRVLREVLEKYPRNLRARLYLAETLLEEGMAEESLRLLDGIEAARGGDPAERLLVQERAARLRPKVLEALED